MREESGFHLPLCYIVSFSETIKGKRIGLLQLHMSGFKKHRNYLRKIIFTIVQEHLKIRDKSNYDIFMQDMYSRKKISPIHGSHCLALKVAFSRKGL